MHRLALVLLLTACGKDSGSVGGASPEAPLRELIAASARGDAGAMRHALVSPDRLRKAITCPADSAMFSDLEGAIEAVGEAARELEDAKPRVELRSMVETGRTSIAKGDSFRGCTANEPFEVRNYSLKVHLAALGHEEETDDTGDVIQLDGRWYALLKN